MKFKWAFIIVLVLFVLSNLGWLYISLDQLVTYDYTIQGYKYLKEDIKLMRNLMTDFCKHENKEEILKILRDKYSDHIIKEEGILFVDRIGLKFEGDKLSKIVFMNEP